MNLGNIYYCSSTQPDNCPPEMFKNMFSC